MARGHLKRLYDEGQVSPREARRSIGSQGRGVVHANHIDSVYGAGQINDPRHQQGDDPKNLGFRKPRNFGPPRGVVGRDHINDGGTPGYGAPDAGSIDARNNRRMFPKESTPGRQPLPGNSNASFSTNWYSAGPGRERG